MRPRALSAVGVEIDQIGCPLKQAESLVVGLVEHDLVASIPMRQFGTLIDFSESPTGPSGPPPLVGEHTRGNMERLGYSSQEIEDLLTRGIVYEPTEDNRWTL